MDEARAVNKIVVNLPQEKLDLKKKIKENHTQVEEVEHWKKVALDSRDKYERKRLTH